MSRQRLIFAQNKKDDAMKNLESKYSEQVLSKAKKAKGNDNIVALAGAFSECNIDDWKLEKEHYLQSKHLLLHNS